MYHLTMPKLRDGGDLASISDVGPGDYVKLAGGRGWEKILQRAVDTEKHPRTWSITTESGSYGICCIFAYAKADAIEDDLTATALNAEAAPPP